MTWAEAKTKITHTFCSQLQFATTINQGECTLEVVQIG